MASETRHDRREAKPALTTSAAARAEAQSALTRAREGGEEDIAAALSALASLPSAVTAAAVAELAHASQADALPLLVLMAERGPKPVAFGAVEAMATVRLPEAAAALQRLAATVTDKDLRKAAKRSLFRLHAAGVAAPAAPSEVQRPAKLEVLVSKITNPEASGSRFLILATEAPLGAADIVSLILSDEEGLIGGGGARVSRGELARRTELAFHETEGLHLVDAPADYLRQIIQEAHERNRATGKRGPKEYYRWAGVIGAPRRRYEREPVYDEIDPAIVRWNPQLLDESAALFHLPEFGFWLMPPEATLEAARNASRTRDTRLFLPGEPERREELRVVERLAESFFTEAQRLKYKARLEQTAYVLLKMGHVLAARWAVAAALAMDPTSRVPIARQPFAVEMAIHTIEFMQAESEHHRARSGGLVLPG